MVVAFEEMDQYQTILQVTLILSACYPYPYELAQDDRKDTGRLTWLYRRVGTGSRKKHHYREEESWGKHYVGMQII